MTIDLMLSLNYRHRDTTYLTDLKWEREFLSVVKNKNERKNHNSAILRGQLKLN